MFVDMDLEHRTGFRAHVRGLLDDRGRRVLGDCDGQGGVDQRVAAPPPEVRGATLPIGDDLGEHTADPGFLGALGQRRDIDGSPGPRVGDGGEAAAQRFQRGQFRREVGGVLVQRVLQRFPDRLEDLRRLPERLGLAEALGQMVVGVDEARHQKVPVETDGVQVVVGGDEPLGRTCLPEFPGLHQDGLSPYRPVREEQQFGYEQHALARELVGPERACVACPGIRAVCRGGGRVGRAPGRGVPARFRGGARTGGHGRPEEPARAGQSDPGEESASPDTVLPPAPPGDGPPALLLPAGRFPYWIPPALVGGIPLIPMGGIPLVPVGGIPPLVVRQPARLLSVRIRLPIAPEASAHGQQRVCRARDGAGNHRRTRSTAPGGPTLEPCQEAEQAFRHTGFGWSERGRRNTSATAPTPGQSAAGRSGGGVTSRKHERAPAHGTPEAAAHASHLR